jgi:hypothetical protein
MSKVLLLDALGNMPGLVEMSEMDIFTFCDKVAPYLASLKKNLSSPLPLVTISGYSLFESQSKVVPNMYLTLVPSNFQKIIGLNWWASK